MTLHCSTTHNLQRMNITFLGVRGTAPSLRPDQQRYGGHTTCIVVQTDDAEIILDAGTGLSAYTPRPDRPIHLLLSHLHLDHLSGLPTAPLLHAPKTQLHIYGPPGARHAIHTLLTPPYTPLPLEGLPARIHVHELQPGASLQADGLTARIDTHPLNHPGGCLGYRIRHGGHTLVFATDHEHSPGQDEALARFCHRADLLILDAHFDASESPQHRGWGHSDWQTALRLARLAQARRIALIHHHPARRDDQLDAWNAQLQTQHPNAFFAREGSSIQLG